MEPTTPEFDASALPPPPRRSAEEELCNALPRQDPVEAQAILCEAVADLFAGREPAERQLAGLLTLDQHAQPISRRLLALYGSGDAQLRSHDRQFFIAAQKLARTFAQAYELVLARIAPPGGTSTPASVGTLMVHLLRHRQVELLLRLFRYKKRNSEVWQQIHAIHRSACAYGLAKHDPTHAVADGKPPIEQALEHEYIHTLLLGAMGTGQFSPRELLWARTWIARWRASLKLQTWDADGQASEVQGGFVVDPGSVDGLRRPEPCESGQLLHLDTAPLLAAIDTAVVAANAAHGPASPPVPAERHAQAVLLARLRQHFAPVAVHVERRGQRKPVDSAVTAICGLAQIVQVMRDEVHRSRKPGAGSPGPFDEVTILPSGGQARFGNSVMGAGGLDAVTIATVFGVTPRQWQVKDQSDSGCRMRGQTNDLNGLIPGSLMAFREGEHAPWTLGVVRRLRRLMVDHVELGVEYLGRSPRYVKIVTGDHLGTLSGDTPSGTQKCLGALYVPASEQHPTMPIRTLLVPAAAFHAGTTLTLISSKATYALRLNKPLEQQAGFVWASFTVIDKVVARAGQASVAAVTPRPHDVRNSSQPGIDAHAAAAARLR